MIRLLTRLWDAADTLVLIPEDSPVPLESLPMPSVSPERAARRPRLTVAGAARMDRERIADDYRRAERRARPLRER